MSLIALLQSQLRSLNFLHVSNVNVLLICCSLSMEFSLKLINICQLHWFNLLNNLIKPGFALFFELLGYTMIVTLIVVLVLGSTHTLTLIVVLVLGSTHILKLIVVLVLGSTHILKLIVVLVLGSTHILKLIVVLVLGSTHILTLIVELVLGSTHTHKSDVASLITFALIGVKIVFAFEYLG